MAISFATISNFFSTSALGQLASNFSGVASEFTKVLYRDGSTTMSGNLDLDSYQIINSADATADSGLVTLRQFNAKIAQLPIPFTGPVGPAGPPGPRGFGVKLFADYGAVGFNANALVDDTAAVAAGLAAGVNSFTTVHYINSQLVIPPNCRLTGNPGGEIFPKTNGFANSQGAFILGPNGSIYMSQSTKLSYLTVCSLDASTPPVITGNVTTDTNAAIARIQKWSGLGVDMGGQDATMKRVVIVGFAQGYKNRNERYQVNECFVDCLNGVETYGVYDTGRTRDCHFYPFWAVHNPSIGATLTTPYQTGMYIHNGSDGCLWSGCLVYGFAVSISIKEVFAGKMSQMWLDGEPTIAASRNTIGVLTQGTNQGVNQFEFDQMHVNSHARSLVLQHGAGWVRFNGTISGSQTNSIELGTGHGHLDVFVNGTNNSQEILCDNGHGVWRVKMVINGGAPGAIVSPSNLSMPRFRLTEFTNIGCQTNPTTAVANTMYQAITQ